MASVVEVCTSMTAPKKPGLALARSPNSTTGYKYVYRGKAGCGAFQAKLKVGRDQRHLGYYDSAEDAAVAVAEALGKKTVLSLEKAVAKLDAKSQARHDYTRVDKVAGLERAVESKVMTKAHRKAREHAALARAEKKATEALAAAERMERCQRLAADAIVALRG